MVRVVPALRALSCRIESEVMNSRSSEEDDRDYAVVVNQEEQYSIWFADRELPKGWRTVGKSGKKPECLKYIAENWTDMRPLSLRNAMNEEQSKLSKS